MKTIIHTVIASCICVFLGMPDDCLAQGGAKKRGKPANQKDYSTSFEASLESAHNSGYKLGHADGHKDGYREGESAGRAAGYKAGHIDGYQACMDQLADSIYRTMSAMWINPSHSDMADVEMIRRDVEQQMRNRNHYRTIAFKDGQIKGYAEGYRDGMALAFDSTYKLHLQRGANIAFRQPNPNYRFTLDYEKIARLLGDADGKKQSIEKRLFGEALYEVNHAILEYLVQVERDTLTAEEASEVFQRYAEIHPALTDMCYRHYQTLCKTLNRNYDKNFYDWQYSVSTEVFLDIVLFNIAAVADVTFTFAKSNSQFAAWEGFELGHIMEIIALHVIVPLEEYFQKNAARLDFDKNFPQLTPVTVAMLTPIVADTRTHRKVVSEKISLAPEHTVWITMEIETIVQVGYWLEDFNIVPDHRNQVVWVNVSNRPRLQNIVKQDYKVTEVLSDISFGYRCSFSDKLSKSDLDAMFERNRDAVLTLDICHAPLRGATIELIAPLLTKVLEPAVAIPFSCYNVKMDFGGKSKQLIHVTCR